MKKTKGKKYKHDFISGTFQSQLAWSHRKENKRLGHVTIHNKLLTFLRAVCELVPCVPPSPSAVLPQRSRCPHPRAASVDCTSDQGLHTATSARA